ncbi:riboflavin synthase domain-like protein [Epithele typhae]|uniref:riboflavin synthase domain-like protein n=1 Tax=Epithele typhae TaxID=378194 RepID=UPI00200728EC|nr:riboflavin synthase domain-like protein [Epithele typhae]KAH9925657.1 riboflavin synthase domain-like protein [Epithele typhae]
MSSSLPSPPPTPLASSHRANGQHDVEHGTAQDVADRLARLCRCLHITAHVRSMDVYPPENLINECSGREPRAMTPLWHFSSAPTCHKTCSRSHVRGVRFGDSSYEKRLQQLGAHEHCGRGEGDEQHHLGSWILTLTEVFSKRSILLTISRPHASLLRTRRAVVDAKRDPLVADRQYHTATFDWNQDHTDTAGDVAVIHSEAAHADVESFLSCIGFANTSDNPILVQHILKGDTTTIREIFTRYLDINATEREKLDEFLSEEGANDPRVLEEFRSAKIPREYGPPPYFFLLALTTSRQAHPRNIHLCIAIVTYRTMLKIPRSGTCTTWLAGLAPGTSSATPVICIGPGTGVAPMRAVIQERVHLSTSGPTKTTTTDRSGRRSPPRLAHLPPAFSRDGPAGAARRYVQDLLRQDAARVWALVGERGARVYVSGSANKMPAGVRAALVFAAESAGGLAEADAREYVAGMEREGRLVEECWS